MRRENVARNAQILLLARSMTYGEIAHEMGLTRNTVAGVVQRDRDKRDELAARQRRLQAAKDELAARGIVVAPL